MVNGPTYVFDAQVQRTKSFLLENCLEAYDWIDRRELTRRVAAHLSSSYLTAEGVITDLLESRTLQAHYGRLRVSPGSIMS